MAYVAIIDHYTRGPKRGITFSQALRSFSGAGGNPLVYVPSRSTSLEQVLSLVSTMVHTRLIGMHVHVDSKIILRGNTCMHVTF